MSSEIYSSENIRYILRPILEAHGVKKAVLFGSYSKGTATAGSDVDILVDSGLRVLRFIGLVESIREALDKDVDVFDVRHINSGSPVDSEIKQTGQVIYVSRGISYTD